MEKGLHLENVYVDFGFDVIEEVDVVGNQDNAISAFIGFDEEISDFLGVFSIEVSCGFVGDDKFGIVDHGSGDGYFLFFTSRDVFAIGFALIFQFEFC